MLRSFVISTLLVSPAIVAAQSFDAKMPASVPQVTGTAVENLTMHYIDIVTGTGAPAVPGKQYTVHYTGWLRDGTKFDSSIGKDPLKFVQGRRLLIAGWEVGFEGMRAGAESGGSSFPINWRTVSRAAGPFRRKPN